MTNSVLTRLIGVLLIIAVLSCTGSDSIAQTLPGHPLFNVGYRVLDLPCRDNGRDTMLTVAVWYPTAAEPKMHNYGGPTIGKVALDAAALTARGPFPMLVFSHGYGALREYTVRVDEKRRRKAYSHESRASP